MKRTALVVAVALCLLTVCLASNTSRIYAQSNTLVLDSFSRDLKNSWGSANTGGSYSLSGTADYFDVPNVGQMKLQTNATLSAYLASVAVRDVDIKFRVKRNKAVAGGVHIAYFAARRTANGTNYLGRLRFAKDGSVRLIAIAEVGGSQTQIGGEKIVPNVSAGANSYIWVRGQLTGKNPTTIRLKAWAMDKPEPNEWFYTATDNTSQLQTGGGVGLRSYLGTGATNAPVLFLYDDLTATNINSPSPTAVPVQPTPTPAPSAPKIYWGALVEGYAPSNEKIVAFDEFEQRAKKKMSILHWGAPWKMNNQYLKFQTSYMTTVRNRGSIPLLDWSSMHLGSGVDQPDFQLRDVYNGNHDAFLIQWAKDAKAWGHPFFLRMNWEMNGPWYPWGELVNGNSPGDFVKMWRHVHDIFEQQGVNNVTWVWCPNISSSTTLALSGLYPGDAYVDWTCLDGYNKYSTWLNFDQIFNGVGITWLYKSYDQLVALAPSKPIMIAEFASLEAGDDGSKKGQWFKDTFLSIVPTKFPKIKALVYFNWDNRDPKNTFVIQTSQKSIDGFAQGVASPLYPANIYGNLNTSPIPPLP